MPKLGLGRRIANAAKRIIQATGQALGLVKKPTPIPKPTPKPSIVPSSFQKYPSLEGKGKIRHQLGQQVVLPKIRPYQYQGTAIIRFKSSGDEIQWYSGIVTSSKALTKDQLRQQIIKEITSHFSNSPVDVLSVGMVYARRA